MNLDNGRLLLKLAGVTFENRQEVCRHLRIGDKLKLMKEPYNPYDNYAVKVMYQDQQCGYIPKEYSQSIAELIDENDDYYEVFVRDIQGGGDYNIVITIDLIPKKNETDINKKKLDQHGILEKFSLRVHS
jgi:hypothetical protein